MRNFVQCYACARVRFDLHYAEIALEAIYDFNYARMQIEIAWLLTFNQA